jgi:hypothetical protein
MAELSGVSDFVLLVGAALGCVALVAILHHWMGGIGWFSDSTSDPRSDGPRRSSD